MDFISQFQQLLLEKPRYALKQVMSENCSYADTALKSKNAYYSFCTFYCEDVLYARYSRKCVDCCGITLCSDCELCIECADCVSCYDCVHCANCSNTNTCWYCTDCYGCSDCFGCIGLYQKRYHIYNQPYSKSDYEKIINSVDLKDLKTQKGIKLKLEELSKRAPRLSIHQTQCEDSIGENLANCKSCYQCYDTFNSEDCIYNIETNGNKDSVDISVCFECEQCYSCVQSTLSYNCNFLFYTDVSSDSEFCAFSRNLKNCFGCVYLEHKQYHILNKPFSKEEYEIKVAEIKQQLIAQNQYSIDCYFVSDYERSRLATESDPVIQSMLPD